MIDACADNLLRMSFNVDFTREAGWARALLDDKDWRDAGLRYTSQLDLLPFGQLTTTERENEAAYQRLFSQFTLALQSLKEKGHYQWILVDLPHGAGTLTRQLIAQCDHVLSIVNVDANCHIRLHQQGLPQNAHLLINDLRIGSQIQDDLYQVWLQSQRRLLPIVIHRDEGMAESLASKQPLG